jgi:PIN domain nuclease of toxin-antitoxin system
VTAFLPGLLIASAFLPGRRPRDPADRIIAATARAHDLAIVTRDSELIPNGEAGHVVTIAC